MHARAIISDMVGYKVMRRSQPGPKCPHKNRNGEPCGWYAGEGTRHPGLGVCVRHSGGWPLIEATWRKAMDVAQELNVTPYEALLMSVRQAAGRVAWTELQLRDAVDRHRGSGGNPSDPSGDMKFWMAESRRERTLAARIAKASVDAGVAAALVRRLEMEGAAVADAVIAALDVLELDSEQRMRALGAAQQRLLTMGDESAT